MRELLIAAAERAIRYLEGLNGRGVAPDPTVVARLAELDIPLPDHPSPADETVALLDSYSGGDDGDGRATLLWLRDRWGVTGNPGSELAGGCLGSKFCSGRGHTAYREAGGRCAALAPRCARLAARNGCGVRHRRDDGEFHLPGRGAPYRPCSKQDGMWKPMACLARQKSTVVVGEEAHPTLFKSLGLAGFGRNRVVRVPVDKQGRMRADVFPNLSGPTIVCLQAGNVNTGAFDPAPEIIPKAKAANAWVHVDGAFGLWAAAAPSKAHLMAGYADADSWATDAHKYLNTPYDSGLAFVRYPDVLQAAMAVSAAYLPSSSTRDPANFTPELSRRARGIEVWAALHTLGRSGLADLVERTCRYAARFAEGLRAAGYTILNEVVLNQVLVTFGDAERTRRVIAGIQQDGTCWCGGTIWQGQTAMRISVSSWATTEEDVERSLEAMIRVARELA